MKFYATALLLFISLYSFGQVDCSEYKTGKFVVKNDQFGNSQIKRTKKCQKETSTNPNNGDKNKTKDKVIWSDECTYQLIPIKIKDPENIIGEAILTFEIIETGSDYYIVHVTGLDNFEIDVKVERQ